MVLSATADFSLDPVLAERVCCNRNAGSRRVATPSNRVNRRNREKLNQRLRGLEDRQQAREQYRLARQKAYRVASMMRQQGTLRGARMYLELKGIAYRESPNPVTGGSELNGSLARSFGLATA